MRFQHLFLGINHIPMVTISTISSQSKERVCVYLFGCSHWVSYYMYVLFYNHFFIYCKVILTNLYFIYSLHLLDILNTMQMDRHRWI